MDSQLVRPACNIVDIENPLAQVKRYVLVNYIYFSNIYSMQYLLSMKISLKAVRFA